MALKYMEGRELIRRLLSGERDFSRIRLEEGFNFDNPDFTHNLREYLSSQDFSKDPVILHSSELKYIKLHNYNFAFTSGEGVDFTGADLTGSDFQKAYLRESSFLEANLQQVKFREAYLENADLRGSKLDYTVFLHASLRSADLREAVLNEALFDHTNLYCADLRNVSGLANTHFINTARFGSTKVTEREKEILERLRNQPNEFCVMNK